MQGRSRRRRGSASPQPAQVGAAAAEDERPHLGDAGKATHRVRAVPWTTGLVSSPMPLAETVTVSPGIRNCGGSMNVPQPAGGPRYTESPPSREKNQAN